MPTLKRDGVSISVPPGWQERPSGNKALFVLVGPAESGSQPNLVVTVDATGKGETAERFAERQLHELKAALADYKLGTEGKRTFGRLVGFLREHRFVTQGRNLAQLQFYVVQDRAYTFTYTASPEQLTARRAVFEALLSQATVA